MEVSGQLHAPPALTPWKETLKQFLWITGEGGCNTGTRSPPSPCPWFSRVTHANVEIVPSKQATTVNRWARWPVTVRLFSSHCFSYDTWKHKICTSNRMWPGGRKQVKCGYSTEMNQYPQWQSCWADSQVTSSNHKPLKITKNKDWDRKR
jgi:hypothetical protein